MNLEESRKEFLDELRTDAATNGTDAGDAFITRIFDMLESIGEFQEPQIYYFGKTFAGNRTMQIDGYCFDTVENSLSLVISDFEDTYTPDGIENPVIPTENDDIYNDHTTSATWKPTWMNEREEN